MNKFEAALSSMPTNKTILKNWGDALTQQLRGLSGREKEKKVWEAVDKYQQIQDALSLLELGDILYQSKEKQTERYIEA